MVKDESIKKILIVVTNASEKGDLNKTGVWLEEFAVPFFLFKEAGHEVTTASPSGGVSPIAQDSLRCENPTEWDYTKEYLDNTKKLDEIDYEQFDAIFLPGGHGPLIDLAFDETLAKIVSDFDEKHKVIGALCHGPAGLLRAKTKNGESFLKQRQLTAFTNEEEKQIGMEKVVPFMLETELKKEGAIFLEEEPESIHIVVDENLITGQNFQSSRCFAETFLKKLKTN